MKHDPSSQSLQLQPATRHTVVDNVYQQLVDAICSGDFPPGSKLKIDELARQLKVSNTPVREALRVLQRDGLVQEVPFSGMYVSDLKVEELHEIYSLRGLVEGYAVRLAADRMDAQAIDEAEEYLQALDDQVRCEDIREFHKLNRTFHDSILRYGGGQVLQDLIAQLVRNSERYLSLVGVLDRIYLDATQAEHRELLKLLRERRSQEAELLTRKHAESFADHLARRLEELKRDRS